MKLHGKDIDERTGAGSVSLTPENAEDFWHVYNLVAVGDQIRASAFRL